MKATLPTSGIALMLLLATAAIFAVMVGWSEAKTMVLLVILALPVTLLAGRIAGPHDAQWITNLVVLAWAAKMISAAARYWALQVLYSGAGDASGYHGAGLTLAPVWRSLQAPFFEPGTSFVDAVTGLLYVPHEPTKLGGFFIYATLAFFGQMLLYSGFRRACPRGNLRWYAGLLFFFPNVLFWPASIGKDSLMMLFIGVAAYAAARMTVSYEFRWLPIFGSGVLGCAWIRSHIALALVLALIITALLGRSGLPRTGLHRVVAVGGIAAIVLFVGQMAIRDFRIDASVVINDELAEEVIDPIFTGVEDQTSQGGSIIEGRAVRSPAEIPGAVLRVIFRPLPPDAHNLQALANSLVEGSLLLALFVWRTPSIARSFLQRLREPYVLFSLTYTAGFVYGHSAILNLGIMARQRSQVIPFVLVLLVALGFSDRTREDSERDTPKSVVGFHKPEPMLQGKAT